MLFLELSITPMTYLTLLLSPMRKVLISVWDFPIIKAFFASLLTITSMVISDNVMGVGVLIGLVMVDQFTGVWVSLREGTFNSFAFRNGLIKLLFYLIIVASFFSLEYLSPIFVWMSLDTAALGWLAMTEVISIVENACNILHIPFPKWLLDRMKLFTKIGKLNLKRKQH